MMKKENLQLLIKSLIPAIKKIVRIEAKKIMKPMINEVVERRVNKILAEQFINSLGTRNLTEEMAPRQREPRYSAPHAAKESGESMTQAKQRILDNMSLDSSSPLAEAFDGLFDDGDDLDSFGGSSGQGTYGDPLEDDGEGISLDSIGLPAGRKFAFNPNKSKS